MKTIVKRKEKEEDCYEDEGEGWGEVERVTDAASSSPLPSDAYMSLFIAMSR